MNEVIYKDRTQKNGVGIATAATAAAALLAMRRKRNAEQQQYPNRFVKRALRLLN